MRSLAAILALCAMCADAAPSFAAMECMAISPPDIGGKTICWGPSTATTYNRDGTYQRYENGRPWLSGTWEVQRADGPVAILLSHDHGGTSSATFDVECHWWVTRRPIKHGAASIVNHGKTCSPPSNSG